MKTSTLLYFWLFAILAGLGVSSLQACPECEKQKIRFKGYYCAQSAYTLQIGDGVANGTAGGSCSSFTNSNLATAKLVPYVEYPITFTGSACTHHISFVDLPEACYQLVVKGGEYSEWTPVTELNHASENGSEPTPPPNWVVMIIEKDSTSSPAGSGQGEIGSAKWRFGLGRTASWQGAGFLSINNSAIDANATSPASLQIIGNPTATSVVDGIRTGGSSGPIRQVKTPEALVDVQTIVNGFELRYYRLSSVGPVSGGVYTLIGTPTPFVTWRVSSPSTNQLQVAKLNGPVSGFTLQQSNLFIHNPAAQSWELREGDGTTLDRIQTRTLTTALNGNTQVIREWKNGAGVQSAKTIDEYASMSWGEEKVVHIDNADGLSGTPRVTSYSYYPDAPGTPSSQQINLITMPDGSFEKYSYTTEPEVMTKLEPVEGGNSDPNLADESNSKATIRTMVPGFHQEVIQIKVLGVSAGQRSNSRAYESGMWTAFSPTNLATTSTRRVSNFSSHPHEFGQLLSVSHPGGADQFYSYDRGDYNRTTHAFTVTATGKASRTTAQPGNLTANESTRTITTYDSNGLTGAERTEVYTGSGWVLLTETFNDYDTDGNLTQTTLNGRITYTATWTNNRKMSETDEAGTETTYTYDSVGRVKTSTKKGVAASAPFALQPDIVTTYTYDGSDRVIGTSTTAGGLTLTTAKQYDGEGRVVSQTDENGLTTTTSYPTPLVTIVTRPDGTTEITTNRLDGRVASVTGTGVIHRHYVYEDAFAQNPPHYKVTEYIGSAGQASPRWSSTEYDIEDRPTIQRRPGFSGAPFVASENIYNSEGQLAKTLRAGMPPLVYLYDDAGSPIAEGEDLNGDDTLTPASLDRYSEESSNYQNIGGEWYSVHKTTQYLLDGNATPTTVSEMREKITGLGGTMKNTTFIDALGTQTVQTVLVDRPAKLVTELEQTSAISTTPATKVTRNGLDVSQSTTTVATPTRFTHDALGRVVGSTDPRLVNSTTAYVPNKNQIAWVKDHLLQQTSFTYHTAGQAGAGQMASVTFANTEKQYFGYNNLGYQTRIWGSATYPSEKVYDDYGAMWKMRTYRGPQPGVWNQTTWPSNPGPAQETVWQRHPATGLLEHKQYPAAAPHAQGGPSYTYDDTYDNRIHTRTWQRGTVTTFGYDTGRLSSYTYNDGTPSVTITYTRDNRVKTIQDASGTRTNTYDAARNLLDETYAGGLLGGTVIDRTRDAVGRLSGVAATSGANLLSSATLTYTPGVGRLETVNSFDASAFYTYEPNSDLIKDISYRLGGNERMKTERGWDNMNRLQSIRHRAAGNTIVDQVTPLYDSVNRRYRKNLVDGTYWSYGYNSRNEVTSGERHYSDDSVLPGWEFDYTFDDIGNRLTGGRNPLSTYSPNDRNVYTSISNSPSTHIIGTSEPTATVTVNGGSTTRKGAFWHSQLAVAPSLFPQFPTVSIQGQAPNLDVQTTGGTVTIRPATETPIHDADGNLLTDGRWTYTWDAENRLKSAESNFEPAGKNLRRLEFAYDGEGRRVQKAVLENISGVWTASSQTLFRYDGWNLISEAKSTGERTSYTWGLDQSGSLQGAGGVGGLLFHRDSTPANFGHFQAAATDENGNVIASVNLQTRALASRLSYGPFGERIAATGNVPRFGWSTKYTDDESGLVYYGFRYYAPETGRWLSKDPAAEVEQIGNDYLSLKNGPVNSIDYMGLWKDKEHYDMIDNMLKSYATETKSKKHRIIKWDCLALTVYDWLVEGNDIVDATGGHGSIGNFITAQNSANSYQHAMRAPNETVAVAQGKTIAFVVNLQKESDQHVANAKQKLKAADKAGAKEEMKKAIIALGKAQHPMADHTSPSHSGFQIWQGLDVAYKVPIVSWGFLSAWWYDHANRETPAIYASMRAAIQPNYENLIKKWLRSALR